MIIYARAHIDNRSFISPKGKGKEYIDARLNILYANVFLPFFFLFFHLISGYLLLCRNNIEYRNVGSIVEIETTT